MLDRLELSDWKDKKPTTFPKALQQKVQFIASVIHDPDVMILDEPFSDSIPSASICSRTSYST